MTFRQSSALLFGVLLPGLVLAQQPPPSSAGADREVRLWQRDDQESTQTKMHEDIEIMRRLLESNLRGIYGIPSFAQSLNHIQGFHPSFGSLFPTTTGATTHYLPEGLAASRNPNAVQSWLGVHESNRDPHGGPFLPTAEGNWLPGHGVVFSMTLPPPSQPGEQEPAKPARKQLSDWERTRLEMRGEKVNLEPLAESKPPSVSGTILKVLADNGKNFSHLKHDEHITVAVTFRSKWTHWGSQCMACHVAPAGGTSGQDPNAPLGGASAGGAGLGDAGFRAGGGDAPVGLGGAADGAGVSLRGGAGSPAGGGAAAGAGGTLHPGSGAGGAAGLHSAGAGAADSGRGDTWSQIEARILLGDLHLKQGRIKEANDTYEKAAEQLEKLMTSTWNWDKEQIKVARELYGKMIQAYLSAGDLERARQVMTRIEKIPNPFSATAQRSQPINPTPASPPLPAKLIVSVAKSLLDQVGSGKLSFDDFKKQATVRYLTFAPPETKPGGGGAGGKLSEPSK
jgi:hypothetical protein